MRAHLVLKRAEGGRTAESVFPTAATIHQFTASPETVQKAKDAAKRLGFKIVSATPLQVTIEGPKQQFEKAFSSRIKSAGGVGKSAPTKKSARKKPPARETVVNDAWTWETAPELPAELQDAVAEIVLPQAIALH